MKSSYYSIWCSVRGEVHGRLEVGKMGEKVEESDAGNLKQCFSGHTALKPQRGFAWP